MSKLDERIVIESTGFGYINPNAKVVIVGITPGNSQLEGDRKGMLPKDIKRKYAFAGNLRLNLIKMLDYIKLNRLLDIESCSSLWEENFDKVEMTSLLKDATYEIKKDGRKVMFKDIPKIEKSEKLMKLFKEGFVKDCESYTNAILFVACGAKVYHVLMNLKKEGIISASILAIAHPSGSNMGRVHCYLGLKDPKDSSYTRCMKKAEEAKRIVECLYSKYT